jgi:hypothetical protein
MQNVHHEHRTTRASLTCLRCGQVGRFVQFTSYLAELVDPDGNHLELMHSEIDRWECAECGGEARWREMPR